MATVEEEEEWFGSRVSCFMLLLSLSSLFSRFYSAYPLYTSRFYTTTCYYSFSPFRFRSFHFFACFTLSQPSF